MEKVKEGAWDRDADFEHSFCKVVNKAEKNDQLVEVLLAELPAGADNLHLSRHLRFFSFK